MSTPLPARADPARAGRICVVRLTTLYRRPVFADAEAARAVCALHRRRWPWRDAGLLAWLLLPDQWLGMLRIGASEPVASVVGRFKAASSRVVEGHHLVNGWLWGRGFRDRLLAPEEDARAVGADLLAEALRCGLVTRLVDWPYWHAAWRAEAGNDGALG